MINPYAILGAVLFWIVSITSAFFYGQHVANAEHGAKQGVIAASVEAKEDKRDVAIDAIGTAAREGVLAALNENRNLGNERTERIRTVVVPSDCRAVNPAILRELSAAGNDINAALRSGLRPSTAPASATNPE